MRVECAAQPGWKIGLCLFVENVHFVLIETFCTAELKPSLPVPKIQVFFCVPYVFTPVTHLVSFEVGSPAGRKAFLAAEAFHLASHTQGIALDPHFLAPGTHYLYI